MRNKDSAASCSVASATTLPLSNNRGITSHFEVKVSAVNHSQVGEMWRLSCSGEPSVNVMDVMDETITTELTELTTRSQSQMPWLIWMVVQTVAFGPDTSIASYQRETSPSCHLRSSRVTRLRTKSPFSRNWHNIILLFRKIDLTLWKKQAGEDVREVSVSFFRL